MRGSRCEFQQYPRLFGKFHREVFCWMDKWVEYNMEDIRAIEAKAKEELDDQRRKGSVKGMKADKDP